MKGVKGILLGVLAVTLVATALLLGWSDEAIEPEVLTTLAPPPPVAPALNLFHPLVGFAVALDADPAAEGEAAVSRVNRLIRSDNATQGDPAIAQAWIVPVAKLHDPQSVLCEVRADDCLAQLWSRRGELDQVVATNTSLLARFRALAAFPRLQNTVDPDPRAPFPNFSLLLATHRLMVARAVIGYLQRDADARNELIADITFVRRMLRQADNVILKMVAASMLADALHGYAALLDRPASAQVPQPEIAALTDAEISLDTALLGEFRFIASGIQSLSREGSVHSEMGIPTWFDGVLLNPLFKPNRSLNHEFACWEAAVAATHAPASTLTASGLVTASPACEPGISDWVLNPVGTILSKIARADFRDYARRLHDLQGLVTLVNLKRSIRGSSIARDQVSDYVKTSGFTDPYLAAPMLWDDVTKTLHFVSPHPETGYNRLVLTPIVF